MKKSLILVVALLCMASLMAAMAYTSATVTNGASFTLAKTAQSLLALEAGDHAAASYLEKTSGHVDKLVIDWKKGNDDGEYGVQRGSEYTWEKLFKVTNNSENPVEVTIDLNKIKEVNPNSIGSDLMFKKHTASEAEWTTLWSPHAADVGNEYTFRLGAGKSAWIDSKIVTDDDKEIKIRLSDFDLIVDAERL